MDEELDKEKRKSIFDGVGDAVYDESEEEDIDLRMESDSEEEIDESHRKSVGGKEEVDDEKKSADQDDESETHSIEGVHDENEECVLEEEEAYEELEEEEEEEENEEAEEGEEIGEEEIEEVDEEEEITDEHRIVDSDHEGEESKNVKAISKRENSRPVAAASKEIKMIANSSEDEMTMEKPNQENKTRGSLKDHPEEQEDPHSKDSEKPAVESQDSNCRKQKSKEEPEDHIGNCSPLRRDSFSECEEQDDLCSPQRRDVETTETETDDSDQQDFPTESLLKELHDLNASCERSFLSKSMLPQQHRTPKKQRKSDSKVEGSRSSTPIEKRVKKKTSAQKRSRDEKEEDCPKLKEGKSLKTIATLKSNEGDSNESDEGSLQIVAEDENPKKRKSASPYKSKKKVRPMDSVDVPQEVIELIQSGIDEVLEEKAERTHLTAVHVKNIIKNVMTDENVLAMVRNTVLGINTGGEESTIVYEPTLTRAKTNEIIQQQAEGTGKRSIWAELSKTNTNAGTSPNPETQALVMTDFPDEDEDEEYTPEADEHLPSDDESFISTTTQGSAFGSPTTPFTPTTPASITTPCSVQSASDLKSPIHADDKRVQLLKQNSAQRMLNFEKEGLVSQRTRSKLPLTETALESLEMAFEPPDVTNDMYESEVLDDDWKTFLIDFIHPLESTEGAEDEEADPEYNILEDTEDANDLREEMRGDRAVQISKKEINDLLTELLGTLDSDEEATGPVRKHLSLHINSNTPKKKQPPIKVTEPVKETENGPPSNTIWVEILTAKFSPYQLDVLRQQMAQHTQLLTTSVLLCDGLSSTWSDKAVSMLEEMKDLSQASGIKSTFYQPFNLDSAFKTVELYRQNATESTGNTEKKSLNTLDLNKRVIEAILESTAFPFPHLLPKRMFMKSTHTSKTVFAPSEDILIAMCFMNTAEKQADSSKKAPIQIKNLIKEGMKEITVNKTLYQISTRIKNIRRRLKENIESKNPLAILLDTGKLHIPNAMLQPIAPFYPCQVINYPENILEDPWKKIIMKWQKKFKNDSEKLSSVQERLKAEHVRFNQDLKYGGINPLQKTVQKMLIIHSGGTSTHIILPTTLASLPEGNVSSPMILPTTLASDASLSEGNVSSPIIIPTTLPSVASLPEVDVLSPITYSLPGITSVVAPSTSTTNSPSVAEPVNVIKSSAVKDQTQSTIYQKPRSSRGKKKMKALATIKNVDGHSSGAVDNADITGTNIDKNLSDIDENKDAPHIFSDESDLPDLSSSGTAIISDECKLIQSSVSSNVKDKQEESKDKRISCIEIEDTNDVTKGDSTMPGSETSDTRGTGNIISLHKGIDCIQETPQKIASPSLVSVTTPNLHMPSLLNTPEREDDSIRSSTIGARTETPSSPSSRLPESSGSMKNEEHELAKTKEKPKGSAHGDSSETQSVIPSSSHVTSATLVTSIYHSPISSSAIDGQGNVNLIVNLSPKKTHTSYRKISPAKILRSPMKTSPMKKVSPILRKYGYRKKIRQCSKKLSPILPKISPQTQRIRSSAQRRLTPKISNAGTSVQSSQIISQNKVEEERDIPSNSETSVNKAADNNSNHQRPDPVHQAEEDFEEDFLEEEEEEEEEEDSEAAQQREEHLAALLKASSTIVGKRGDRLGGNDMGSTERRLNKQQQRLQARITALSIVQDSLAKDKSMAQCYLMRVQDALTCKDPLLYKNFLTILNEFTESADSSPVELYSQLCEVLKDFPLLKEEFVSFLTPQQAIAIGKYPQYCAIHRMRDFLDKLKLQFRKQPQCIQKIIRALQSFQTLADLDFDKVKATICPLLRYPHLVESFTQCFGSQPPPPSLSEDFEDVSLERSHTPDSVEDLVLPEDDPVTSPDHCVCPCHVSGSSSATILTSSNSTSANSARGDHCQSCAIRFSEGRVYLQYGKTLRPARVTYHSFEPASSDGKSRRCQVDTGTSKETHAASDTVDVVTKGKGAIQRKASLHKETVDSGSAKNKENICSNSTTIANSTTGILEQRVPVGSSLADNVTSVVPKQSSGRSKGDGSEVANVTQWKENACGRSSHSKKVVPSRNCEKSDGHMNQESISGVLNPLNKSSTLSHGVHSKMKDAAHLDTNLNTLKSSRKSVASSKTVKDVQSNTSSGVSNSRTKFSLQSYSDSDKDERLGRVSASSSAGTDKQVQKSLQSSQEKTVLVKGRKASENTFSAANRTESSSVSTMKMNPSGGNLSTSGTSKSKSDESLCVERHSGSMAKSSNLPKSIEWTREEDKLILLTIQKNGASDSIIRDIMKVIPHRNQSEVFKRFNTLVKHMMEEAEMEEVALSSEDDSVKE